MPTSEQLLTELAYFRQEYDQAWSLNDVRSVALSAQITRLVKLIHRIYPNTSHYSYT